MLVGTPASGDRVSYIGNDGTRITATVVGPAVRSDGFQDLHEVLLIEYRLYPANHPKVDVRIEEAVDVETGLQVRHDVLCLLGGTPEEISCDSDYVKVHFAATGFPGALGVAPFWGTSIQEGVSEIPGGRCFSSIESARRYGFTDIDGRTPDFERILEGLKEKKSADADLFAT